MVQAPLTLRQICAWKDGKPLAVCNGAAPGDTGLWASEKLGVAHVVFGPAGVTVNYLESGDAQVHPMTFDSATTVPVWLVADATVESAR